MNNKPHYSLWLLNKDNPEEKGEIGVAWVNDDGSLTVKINPLVTLVSNPKYVIRLYPTDPDYQTVKTKKGNKYGRVERYKRDVPDDRYNPERVAPF